MASIVFFGSGPVAAASLDYISKKFDIEAVITKTVPPHHKHTAPVEELAKQLKLPIRFANTKKELDETIAQNHLTSRIGLLVDYGVIVSQQVIDSFELGIVNSHFSLLPQWRGADPITFSILSGQPKTGVSIMLIDSGLDTGKLLTQKNIKINPDETSTSLTKRLVELSNSLLSEYIPRYQSGEIKPKNQPHPDRATYSRKLTKADGLIDFQKPAEQIEREVRAFAGWPKSRATINNVSVIVTKSHVTEKKIDELDVLCVDGEYLSIDELVAPSGKSMSAAAFINGYF